MDHLPKDCRFKISQFFCYVDMILKAVFGYLGVDNEYNLRCIKLFLVHAKMQLTGTV